MKPYPPINELLPHEFPMIVIDGVHGCSAEWAESITVVQPEHVLYDADEGGLPGWALIELMAQTIALHAGLLGGENGRQPRIGYLLGTRRFELARDACYAGEILRTRVEREFVDPEGVSVYQCEVFSGNAGVARARINVFQKRD